MTEDAIEEKREGDDKKEKNWEQEMQVIKNERQQRRKKGNLKKLEEYFTMYFSSYK